MIYCFPAARAAATSFSAFSPVARSGLGARVDTARGLTVSQQQSLNHGNRMVSASRAARGRAQSAAADQGLYFHYSRVNK